MPPVIHRPNIRLFGICLLIACAASIPRTASAQESVGSTPDTAADWSSASPVTSEFVIRSDLLRDLPIDDARQAFVLSPGVVMRGGEIGIDSTPTFSLRGGDPGTAAAYIDGAPVRSQILGTQHVALGTNAISQVSVVTGVPSALASDARDGMISYVTRGGGSRFAGNFRAATDEAFPTAGYNRFEGDLGGPLTSYLTWFVSAALQGERSHYRGLGASDLPTYVISGLDTTVTVNKADGSGVQSVAIPRFVQYSGQCSRGSNDGVECQGMRLPMDWSTARRGQAKLLYAYGAGSSVSLTGVTSDLDQRFFPGKVIGDPFLYHGADQTSRLAVVNWTHGLRQSPHGSLRLHVNLSVASDEQVSGPLDPASELTTRDPALGIDFSTLHFTAGDIIPFPLTDEIIRNVRLNQGFRIPYIGRSDLLATQAYRTNPYGLSASQGWYTGGVDDGRLLTQSWERRWNGRGFVEWQPGGMQSVTFGGDVERTDASYYTASLSDEIGLDAFLAHPRRSGVFADYRAQPGHVVIDLGVRFDRFDPGGEFPKTPGRISSNPAWGRTAGTSDAAYDSAVARVFDPGKTQSAVTPRIRFGYALTPRTSIRFGFGQEVERPSLQAAFGLTNGDLSFVSTNSFFGRDVKYVKSTMFEFGVKQAVGRSLALDVAIHSKDHFEPYLYRFETFPDPANPGATQQILVLTPSGRNAATGLDAQLQWRRSAVTGSLAYSLLRVPSGIDFATLSPFSPGVAPPPDFIEHALSALVLLRVPETWRAGTVWGAAFGHLSAVAMFRLASGFPYTRLANTGLGIVAPATDANTIEPINSSRTPATKTLDLILRKGVRSRGIDLSFYADFRNLLNFLNTRGVFAETGTTTNDKYRQRFEASEVSTLISEAGQNGAYRPDGSIDLSNCAGWIGDAGPVNCISLRRVEARFGDGDKIYTRAEQIRALDTYYDSFLGAWRFLGPGRTARLGVELRF